MGNLAVALDAIRAQGQAATAQQSGAESLAEPAANQSPADASRFAEGPPRPVWDVPETVCRMGDLNHRAVKT